MQGQGDVKSECSQSNQDCHQEPGHQLTRLTARPAAQHHRNEIPEVVLGLLLQVTCEENGAMKNGSQSWDVGRAVQCHHSRGCCDGPRL